MCTRLALCHTHQPCVPYTPLEVLLPSLASLNFQPQFKTPEQGKDYTDFSRLWTLDFWNKFQIPAAFCLSKEDKLSGLLNTAWVFRQDLENSRSLLKRDIKHPVTLSMRTNETNQTFSYPFQTLSPGKDWLVPVFHPGPCCLSVLL